jgi:hypothetical protein
MRVIVTANDWLLYESTFKDSAWQGGRCTLGTVAPTKGARCDKCPARVELVITEETGK